MIFNTTPASPAIFIDKDGTLVRDVPYNTDPKLLEFTPGAVPFLAAMKKAGFKLILVTNQPGIAMNLFKETAFLNYIGHMNQQLNSRLDGVYYCAHNRPGADGRFHCDCRKPLPGLILKAAFEQRISLEDSWMIGDILDDVEAGNRAGCQTILLNNGGETEWIAGPMRTPDFTVKRFEEAEAIILKKAHHETRSRY